MNCQSIQNKILILPDPRVIPDALRDHIVGCEVCRAWALQVARLDALLQQLPVPPAPGNKKATIVDDVTYSYPVITRPLATPARESFAGSVLKFLDQNKTVIGGLAAAVLVVLGGWWLLTPSGTPEIVAAHETPEHPFLKEIVERNVALANAKKPVDRLRILGGFAEDLSTEARTLARVANEDELGDVALWFDNVVKDGVVNQAQQMPVDTLTLSARAERKTQLVDLAGKLSDVATKTEKMTQEVPPHAKAALQKIVDSARAGEKKLREMANAG